MEDELEVWLRRWVVSDYFTPSIKAEVILDTLLTPYVAGIVKDQCKDEVGEAVFITKEMSVESSSVSEPPQENDAYGDMGAKVDYILADERNKNAEHGNVYMLELKTTDNSIKGEQASLYLTNCTHEAPKTFGEVFGEKLLRILSKKMKMDLPKEEKGEERLRALFDEIMRDHGVSALPRAEQARALLKENNWGSTYKYLYTAGQLLDYIYPAGCGERPLWDKRLRLLYLTPRGSLPHPAFADHTDFYLPAQRTASLSLTEAIRYLDTQNKPARLLADILRELYIREGN